ncbi:hypothetical protein J6590_072557 [Homalodisca vitripennis]|nr:hypothetical protein J6590_072557 [Homalodisca vitripennis]
MLFSFPQKSIRIPIPEGCFEKYTPSDPSLLSGLVMRSVGFHYHLLENGQEQVPFRDTPASLTGFFKSLEVPLTFYAGRDSIFRVAEILQRLETSTYTTALELLLESYWRKKWKRHFARSANWYTPDLAHLRSFIGIVCDMSKNRSNLKPWVQHLRREYRAKVMEAKQAAVGNFIAQSQNPCKAAWDYTNRSKQRVSAPDTNFATAEVFNAYFLNSAKDLVNSSN